MGPFIPMRAVMKSINPGTYSIRGVRVGGDTALGDKNLLTQTHHTASDTHTHTLDCLIVLQR